MTVGAACELIGELDRRGVKLEVGEGGKLRYSPRDKVDKATLAKLGYHKQEIIEVLTDAPINPPRFIQQEIERASELGLIARWSQEFGYISIHDPTTGEWHDIPWKVAPGWARGEARKRKVLYRNGNRPAYDLTASEIQEVWDREHLYLSEEEGIVEDHPLEEDG